MSLATRILAGAAAGVVDFYPPFNYPKDELPNTVYRLVIGGAVFYATQKIAEELQKKVEDMLYTGKVGVAGQAGFAFAVAGLVYNLPAITRLVKAQMDALR